LSETVLLSARAPSSNPMMIVLEELWIRLVERTIASGDRLTKYRKLLVLFDVID
jgi:hypothetical protein